MDRCNCRPTAGYHQHGCDISRRHRRERLEAGKPPERPDPNKRAKVGPERDWIQFDRGLGCGWFRHDWDSGDSERGTGCETSTTRYTCKRCGKTKDRNNGMG